MGSNRMCKVEKRCPKCLVTKPRSSFFTPASGGMSAYCKPCHHKYLWERIRGNPIKHAETKAKKMQQWHAQTPKEKYFVMVRRRFPGLAETDFWDILRSQDGRCPICLRTLSISFGDKSAFHLDHDHRTGRIRGILCGNCNCGIGQLKDLPGNMRRAAEYVETH